MPSAGKQPFPSNSPEYFTSGHRDLSISQITGFYPQSRKAKRSLANFNYVKSSGDAGSFAASQTRRGHPFAREVPPRSPGPCPVEQRLQADTKEVSFLIVLLCCASSNTAQHPGSRTATVSMVSARPISVLGYKTTQQAHFLVSASFCRTNSSTAKKKISSFP